MTKTRIGPNRPRAPKRSRDVARLMRIVGEAQAAPHPDSSTDDLVLPARKTFDLRARLAEPD